MADLLKKDLGLDVSMVLGRPGEFSIWVGDRRVASKWLLFFPSDGTVLSSVRAALTA